MAAPKTWKCFLCLLCATVGLLVLTGPYISRHWFALHWNFKNSSISISFGQHTFQLPLYGDVTEGCDDVLQGMLVGRWHQRTMTSEEVRAMSVFHKRVGLSNERLS